MYHHFTFHYFNTPSDQVLQLKHVGWWTLSIHIQGTASIFVLNSTINKLYTYIHDLKLLWQLNAVKSLQVTNHINSEQKSNISETVSQSSGNDDGDREGLWNVELLLQTDTVGRPRRFYHKDIYIFRSVQLLLNYHSLFITYKWWAWLKFENSLNTHSKHTKFLFLEDLYLWYHKPCKNGLYCICVIISWNYIPVSLQKPHCCM
jgi:hypothetical protein